MRISFCFVDPFIVHELLRSIRTKYAVHLLQLFLATEVQRLRSTVY